MGYILEEQLVRVTFGLPGVIRDQAVELAGQARMRLEDLLAYALGTILTGSGINEAAEKIIEEPVVTVTIELMPGLRDQAAEKAVCVGSSLGNFLVDILRRHLGNPEIVDAYEGGGTSD